MNFCKITNEIYTETNFKNANVDMKMISMYFRFRKFRKKRGHS